MKYSVIIPLYNAAETISRCLDSLLSQPHEDVQILLINDGSTDESGEICRQYAQDHNCVCYFEKENGGVSSARNLGLEKAAGEYILFVDSDDYVTEDYFSVIAQHLNAHAPDMLLFGLQCFGSRQDVWHTGTFWADSPVDVAWQVRKAMYAYLFSNLMTKTYKTEIIRSHKLRFDESLAIGEDQAFTFSYVMHVSSICSIAHVLYLYSRENEESLSCCRREYLGAQLLQVTDSMQQALARTDFCTEIRDIYEDAIAWAHYRSVYSVCKELRKTVLNTSLRREKISVACDAFLKPGIAARGIRTGIIAIPVKSKACFLLDYISAHSSFWRKIVN